MTKKVTGSLGDKDKKFNVDVTFTAPAGKTVKSTITYVNDGEKSIAPDAWKLNTTTNKYEANVTVELAHKGFVQFNNIPKDVTYIVAEQDYSGQEYTAKYDGSESGTIANDVKSTTITNNKGDDNIDTGVILDNAPYILMLTVVAAGAMTLVIKKRREEE